VVRNFGQIDLETFERLFPEFLLWRIFLKW
jgi:hypothetical protein